MKMIYGTSAQWAATTRILEVGQFGYDSTSDTLKVGDGATAWASLPAVGAGGGATWGTIGGTLSSQTDLNSALAGKAATSHTHAQSDVTGLVSDLAGKQATLVSGTNIKTLNSTSLLGSGDIAIVGLTDGDKGDVTVSGSGATWTIDNGVVTLAKMADMATSSLFYRKTAGTGAPEVQTLATLKADLGLTGTNSGDQTTIVGITGTKAQFNTAVTDGDFLFVGDVTSNATHTGDVTGSTALTIANDAVTYAKMQNVTATNRFLGRITAGSGDVEELTGTQATTLLDNFTTTLKGLVPGSGGGTSNFLRADGTWAAPPAGGSLALTDLTDVTITSGAQGQSVVRGASEFVNLTSLTVTLGPFYINDAAGTATTQATLGYFNTGTALSRNSNDIRMDVGGRVVGAIITSDAARTAGTATVQVRVAGVATAFNGGSVALDATNTTSDSGFVAWGSGVSFTAGQTLGAAVVTSGWTPTSADFSVWLVVMLQY